MMKVSRSKTITSTTPLIVPAHELVAKEEAKTNKIWNRFADDYAKAPIEDEISYLRKVAMTREYLKPDMDVLEIGCGTAGTAILHAPFVKHIHAIDISSRMIEIASEKVEAAKATDKISLQCIGVDSYEARDKSFDVILGLSLMLFFPENREEILAKIRKMLKPGGIFVSSTHCLGDHCIKKKGFVSKAAAFGNRMGFLPKLDIFTKEELRTSLEKAGFEIETEFHPGKDKAVFLIAKRK